MHPKNGFFCIVSSLEIKLGGIDRSGIMVIVVLVT